MAVVRSASNVDNANLLIENDDNCVTVESAPLDLTTEEALLAQDEDMENDVHKNYEKLSDMAINRKVDGKEILTPDEKAPKKGVKKNVTQAEREVEDAKVDDDIIVLDDEEAESGASTSKRPKEDDDMMEVDESKEEPVENIIRKMKRQELEDLILAKIVEGIVAHTEIGQLRGKVLELQMQKDKMANKMGFIVKQVAELSSAVNVLLENEQRNPKNQIKKPNIIRFCRSVALQVSIEQSVRTAPLTKVRVQDEPVKNEVKPHGRANARKGSSNGVFQIPQPVKRSHQGNKAGNNKSFPAKQANAPVASPRKVFSATPSQVPPRLLPVVPKTNIASQNAQQKIVDLTDDDLPTSATSSVLSAPATVASSSVGVPPTTTFRNGVQCQNVNRPGGQSRPVLLQQLSNQPIILSRANNPPGTQKGPRPRQGINVPRVAATIRGPGSALGANCNAPKRFILPPLPATPFHKIQRNDNQRPPAKPELTLLVQADGIVLSWTLPKMLNGNYAEATTYQIFACQDANCSSKPAQWKRVGDVKALPLPMACTLSQFTEENRYYFIVRGIDLYGRFGPFCDPQNVLLRLRKNK